MTEIGVQILPGVSLDLSDEGISKPEQRLSASDGESARRGVPADEMNYKVAQLIKLYSLQHLDDEKFAKHCKKFFKGGGRNEVE